MSRFLAAIAGNIRVLGIWFASLLARNYAPVAVHVLSLEDAIKLEKHIGVFRKPRRRRTSFRRR